MTNQEKLKELFDILEELEAYIRCLGKVSFDMECVAPMEGLEQAGMDMSIVGKRVHELTHSQRFETLIRELHEDGDGLTPVQRKTVEHLYDDWTKEKNITAELDFEFSKASNTAYGDWLKAKKSDDFTMYASSFGTLIANTRKSVELRDEMKATVYDTLLDDYEKGGSIAQLDAFFNAIKARVIPLVRRVQSEGKPIRDDFLSRPVAIPTQEKFSRYLLDLEGLRDSALVLMTTEHPFTTSFGNHDVRVATHYYEDNFFSNTYSILHEGGHALFMQNEPQELHDNHCADRMTAGMHETISRFYENLVGRSEEFIGLVSPKLRELTGDTFDDVTDRELYEAVNIASPCLVRTHADELTYPLHILVRYELEKMFINDEITVEQIPEEWNRRYKEYLGLDVPSYADGCLQDVHWTGMFGYFPSYALGNAYGVQILRTMEKDFDFYGAIKAGELSKIADWLRERVFSIAGLKTPDEWINAITGESLNVNYYLDYLEEKFTKLYGLQ